MMYALLRDLGYSARLLRNKSGYAIVVVLTLALGIGAVTSVFSVVNAVLLRPYGPFNADQWVYIWEQRTKSQGLNQISVSIPNFRDWKNSSTAIFSDVVVWLPWSYTASGPGVSNPERIRAAVISPEIFSAVTVAPAAGRLLSPEDTKSGERRVVLSYQFWRRAYGLDPALPGKNIRLNSVAHTVVGVAPPEFAFPPEDQVDVWTALPQGVLSSADRSARGYRVAAKLRPGVTLQTAQLGLNAITDRLSALYPEDREYGAMAVRMREGAAGEFRTPLVALSGAVTFLLLLLCINIGYLRVVHLEARRKEIALRVAMGAGPTVLIRQLLMDTVLLFGIGGGLGIFLVAPGGIDLLLSFVPAREIPWLHVRIDGVILLGSVAVTALSFILSSLLPVLRASRPNLARSLASGGTIAGNSGAGWRVRGAIIVAQIALALVPLCGAGLLTRSFVHLQEVATGFDPEHRLTLSLAAPKRRYAGPAEITYLAKQIREATLEIPGLKQVGLAQAIPFSSGTRWLQAIARSNPKGMRNISELPLVRYSVITAGYFEAMGIPLKAGRLVTDLDTQSTQPVVLINEKLAKQYFHGEDPIGKQLWIGHAESLPDSPPRIIVGVVGDTRMYALEQEPDPSAWVLMAQQPSSEDLWRNLFVVANEDIHTDSALAAVRRRIQGIDPELGTADVSSMADRVHDSLWRQRFSTSVLGAFSLAGLGVAVLGVFGVTSYLVALRSHEIGVRIACGARPADILKMVLRQSLMLVAIGTALGLAGVFGLTRILQELLYGVKPTDPFTLLVVVSVLAITALVACLVPAQRAAKADPIVTLRAG